MIAATRTESLRLLHMENPFKAIFQFVWDLLVFFLKATFFTLESIYYSLIPDRFRKIKEISGQVVLITGGGGGVGRLLALNFAKLNARVVVWDINQEAIKTTVDLLGRNGFTCKGYVVDISDREQVYERASQTINEVGNVEILCNNAGVVCCRPFWDLPDRVIQNTYNINIISHYWTVKAFLPHMMQNNLGHIVTVGSVTGMLGTYGCSDYSATKFACIGFHESLLTDLKAHGYDRIQMTLICPYYINTGMFSGVRPRMFPMLEPQYVADRIIEAVRKNEVWCVLPNSIRMLTPLKCLLPAKVCWELMSRVIRGPESMMMFQGRGRVPAG
ncbi:PREDICTED: short-chain dehydrogenase/reductase family 16C member 6 [Rhagoletis zephyria]|uniref:short-chain dehydrogenase/reductase family 16C member 6 n=1 Tax=Rhagoletis zephyria TaxID=28612 RepID=UPI0008116A8F|nr:PREDICTED: short-chain dehydrogenase/reductase family 16C member 6 [Rhagoletis zephyria]XP_036327695.1 short-chain dehydrogenase/reductase family 16C member 6 [Rhagoletis pomonella]